MIVTLKKYIRKKLFTENNPSELDRILQIPRFTKGSTTIFGQPFTFHDSLSFVVTYREIFENEIYRFNPSDKRKILDCGANMGLSVVYFSINYPEHKILAFEPDAFLFDILKSNIESLNLTNVELYNNAVWDKEESLVFSTDGGMGGRINDTYKNVETITILALPLKRFLSDDVDFLKIDIEGAEDVVLHSCQEEIRNVQNLFFEYHSSINTAQNLDSLLNVIKNAGFRYHIKESWTRKKPFVDNEIICEAFDMAINIFAKKG